MMKRVLFEVSFIWSSIWRVLSLYCTKRAGQAKNGIQKLLLLFLRCLKVGLLAAVFLVKSNTNYFDHGADISSELFLKA